MTAITQDIRKPRFLGLYLRTKTQTRLWGWGDRNAERLANAPAAEMEQPKATLAEWLRMAHLLLDDKTAKPPLPSDEVDSAAR